MLASRAHKIACLMGLAAAVLAWLVIGVSWYLNREWFVFTEDAFSDFGGRESCCPGLYNYGLMAVGFLLAVFSLCVLQCAKNKFGVVGGAYLLLAGVFLALIGVFPSGHRHHVFVSTWFFIQADIGLIPGLWEAWRLTRDRLYLLGLVLEVLAFPVAIVVEFLWGWPSAAVVESYGVVLIDVGALLLMLYYWSTCIERKSRK